MFFQNAIQLPIKTHAQKVAETARLSSQFPVSSGMKHRCFVGGDLEWVPVDPKTSKTETKPTVSTVSIVAERSIAVVPSVSIESSVLPVPPPPPPPVPVAYPCPPTPEVMPVATATPVPSVLSSTVPLSSIPQPALPPIIQSTTVFQTHQPIVPSYVMPSQQVMLSTVSVAAPTSSSSVFKTPKVSNLTINFLYLLFYKKKKSKSLQLCIFYYVCVKFYCSYIIDNVNNLYVRT